MNLFGKNIDPSALEKISQMLNSPQGAELKKQMQNIDKDALMKMFAQMNVSEKDISDVNRKIKDLSGDEIIKEILKKTGRGRNG